jgi:nucleotide-binding universal stress UspA family protein
VEILICTDGSNSSIQSAGLISKFGFPASAHIVVLGVSEGKDDVEKITASTDQIGRSLGASYSLDKKMRYGDPKKEIITEALEHSYDLVIVGGGGNQLGLLEPQIGSTTGKLARTLHTHFLVVRNVPTNGGGGEVRHDVLIERSTKQLREAGVKNEIVPHIRQGLVVEEVLKEISEGGYELLVVGSHYQPGQDRWLETLLDDITDQLLNRSTCSVLII